MGELESKYKIKSNYHLTIPRISFPNSNLGHYDNLIMDLRFHSLNSVPSETHSENYKKKKKTSVNRFFFAAAAILLLKQTAKNAM